MDIGILSDSHLQEDQVTTSNQEYLSLLKKLLVVFEGVDQIIHAGDIYSDFFIRDLEKIAPTSVVQGNMDPAFGASKWPKKLQETHPSL